MTKRLILFFITLSAAACLSAQSSTFTLMRCTKLSLPMYKNGAAVLGEKLYLLGGRQQKNGWTRKVFSAGIRSDGSLSSFKEELPLPEFRVYIGNSVEVVNDRIYVIAGSIPRNERVPDSDSKNANDVLWTRVQADGSLTEWQRSIPYPGLPVNCAATCSSDRQLFVLGGKSNDVVSDKILVADLDSDGKISNWREERKLPAKLYFHQATMLEDRIYLWGGLQDNDSSSPAAKAYSAEVSKDGKIGNWREETPLPKPFYSSVYCGMNDFLISAGVLYGNGIPSPEIWYNRLQNGKLTKWVSLNTDMELAAFRSLGFDKIRGNVYIVGGLRRDLKGGGPGTGLDSVQAFCLPQPKNVKLTVATQDEKSDKFTSLPEALQKGKQTGKKVLALFYSPEVPACKRLWDGVISTPAFTDFAKPFVFVTVDITKTDAKQFQQYGVFKVPTVLLFGTDGTVEKSTLSPRSMEDIKTLQ